MTWLLKTKDSVRLLILWLLCNELINFRPSTDGILGIGPPGGKSGPADFMKTLMAQNSAVGSQIGFWYNVQDSPSAGQGGELTIGGVDPSRYSGAIQYYPLTVDRSYWMLSMDKVILADGSLLGTDFGNAVVDVMMDLI